MEGGYKALQGQIIYQRLMPRALVIGMLSWPANEIVSLSCDSRQYPPLPIHKVRDQIPSNQWLLWVIEGWLSAGYDMKAQKVP